MNVAQVVAIRPMQHARFQADGHSDPPPKTAMDAWKRCPECLSADISVWNYHSADAPDAYRCNQCDHRFQTPWIAATCQHAADPNHFSDGRAVTCEDCGALLRAADPPPAEAVDQTPYERELDALARQLVRTASVRYLGHAHATLADGTSSFRLIAGMAVALVESSRRRTAKLELARELAEDQSCVYAVESFARQVMDEYEARLLSLGQDGAR